MSFFETDGFIHIAFNKKIYRFRNAKSITKTKLLNKIISLQIYKNMHYKNTFTISFVYARQMANISSTH